MAKSTNGPKSMTPQVLRELCKKNNLYLTPKLNDVLYLHYQGFQDIGGLEEYTGLKCLWLQCNAIGEVKGLDNQVELRCLYLQNNLIKKIENLGQCTQLDTLDLSHNQLRRVDNCTSDVLPVLHTLTIAHNFIRTAADIEDLTRCQMLSVLDLSHNKIDDILVVKTFARMPNLRVLTLTGNPIVGSIPSYRKTLILECLNLNYLDTRPVFPKDRALAEAWKRGGHQAEKEENERWNREERRKMRENINRVLRRRNEIKGQQMVELVASSSDEEEFTKSQTEDLEVKIKKFIEDVERCSQEITEISLPAFEEEADKENTSECSIIPQEDPDLISADLPPLESNESYERGSSLEVNADSEASATVSDATDTDKASLIEDKLVPNNSHDDEEAAIINVINGENNKLEETQQNDENEMLMECKINADRDEVKCNATELIIPEIKEELAEEVRQGDTLDSSGLSTRVAMDTDREFPSTSSENHSRASQTPSPMISILSITIPPDSFSSTTPKHKIEVAPKYQKTSPVKRKSSKEFHSTFNEFLESCERVLQEEKTESERLFARYTEEVNKSYQEMLRETTHTPDEPSASTSQEMEDFEREIDEIGTKVQNLNEARMEKFREDSREVRQLIDGVFEKVSSGGDEEVAFREDCKIITDKLEKLSVLIENPPVNQFDEMIEKFCTETTKEKGATAEESWATDSKMKKIEKFMNSIEPTRDSSCFSGCSATDEAIQIEDIEFCQPPGEETEDNTEEVSEVSKCEERED